MKRDAAARTPKHHGVGDRLGGARPGGGCFIALASHSFISNTDTQAGENGKHTVVLFL